MWASHVEVELSRAVLLVRKDHKQRWVTMDGRIHEEPQPYRDAISVTWHSSCVTYRWRPRALAHPAELCGW